MGLNRPNMSSGDLSAGEGGRRSKFATGNNLVVGGARVRVATSLKCNF